MLLMMHWILLQIQFLLDSESAKKLIHFLWHANSMRQRRKSGFGRRQTFKGLTG